MDFELDISGFDKLKGNLEKIGKKLKGNLEKLGKKGKVKFSELFPDSFIKKYTQFETLENLFESSDFKVNTVKDLDAIPRDDWDKFINDHTNFSSWEDMMGKAYENASGGVAGCQEALSNASQEDFEKISGIGEGIAERLVDAQPFENCSSSDCLNDLLQEVSYVEPTRAEDILNHFCPDLVE